MAKKNDTTSTKPTAPAKRAVKPAAAKTKSAPKPAAKAKPAPKRTAPAAPIYTQDDVALRAYFISEKRRAHGLPGDEHQDWIEAERQVMAESAKSKKTKKV